MKGTHLTLENRIAIQKGIEQGLSKTAIARSIEKDPTTVAKEIKRNRRFKARNPFNRPYICTRQKECINARSASCNAKCPNYVDPSCLRRDRSIGACNLCDKSPHCRLDKYFYNAVKAHQNYLYTLRDSREGVNMNSSELITMAAIIKEPLKKGQSIYQILAGHPELDISAKTLYTYIESGIFKDFGIDNFSLKRQVSMKQRKTLKKRKQPANYQGRTYADYLEFAKENPLIQTTEMDTVYNQQGGPFIQTFLFQHTALMIGFVHEEKTSAAMAGTLDVLQEILGEEYYKLFSLLLTDRGPEFEKFDLFEFNSQTGEIRTNIFYCDPQRPDQKPHVETNHNFVRNILPNRRILKGLSQQELNLMFSHINSVPRKSLQGKTPYEVFSFFYGDSALKKLGIIPIDKDQVTLMPYLIKIGEASALTAE